MLEVLQGLISQAGQQAVVQNPEVPNQHNEGVMSEVMNGLLGGLSNQAQSPGGLGALLPILMGQGGASQSNGLMGNPIVSMIAQNIIGSLMQKFGLSNSAASGVVGNMLPSVLGGLIGRANNPNDNSVDMGSIMGVLSGGRTQGMDMGSLLGAAQGAMADGKLDLSDLIGLATGGGQQQQQQQGGGLGDLLGGILGK